MTFDFWQRLTWAIVGSAGAFLAGSGLNCLVGVQPYWARVLILVAALAVWVPAVFVLHPDSKQCLRAMRSRR